MYAVVGITIEKIDNMHGVTRKIVNVDTGFQLGSESGLTEHCGDQFCLILRVRLKRTSIQLRI